MPRAKPKQKPKPTKRKPSKVKPNKPKAKPSNPKAAKSSKQQPPNPKTTSAAYEQFRNQQAQISRQRSATGRDIGCIPDIADIGRRESCRNDFDRFCTTYNPEAFYLPWAEYQLHGNARIKEAVLLGALYALAEPRGGGKTTRCRMAILWAAAYAHRSYPVIIGANDDKATDSLDALKMFIRFLPLFAADFPEISYPVQCLGGIAQRAHGQMCGGVSTMIEWSANRIILATVPPPKNWPKEWPMRTDGMVPTSGVIIGATGLTAEGIRGTVVTLTTGEQRRPDLVIPDDPQTRESAGSPTQNAKRLQLLSADVLGMAGPDRAISGVMPCTVIEKNDAADQILDRSKHPMWRGERTKMLRTMPKNLDAWREYFEVYERCALAEPPDLTEANAFYVAHRERLDEGAEATWKERKLPGEVSAIQHAMHLWFRDPRAFLSEYQNQPESPEVLTECRQLVEVDLGKKLNTLPRGIVPRDCNRLTAFVDVQDEILFWSVCAWTDKFGGALIDYGTFPAQPRDVFTAADPPRKLSTVFPALELSARIFAGLNELIPNLLSRNYQQYETGNAQTISLCLIDSGHETKTIHGFIGRSPYKALLHASKGRGIKAANKPMNEYSKSPGDRVGDNWRVDAATQAVGKFVSFCANSWKTFFINSLLAPPGASSSFYLFGEKLQQHPLLVTHWLSEYRVPTFGQGRRHEEWMARPGQRENHWLDCCVAAAVAASMLGVTFSAAAAVTGQPDAAEPSRPKATREDYEKKRREFEMRRGAR